MRANSQNKTPTSYFFILVLWMGTMIYLQSHIMHLLPRPFNEIDLATVAMICICLENGMWTSVFIAFLSGGLLDFMSVVKPGFFIVYFLISILIIQSTSKFFSFENLSNKCVVFLGIFLLKFLFIYFLIDDEIISIFSFISKIYIQFIMTLISFFGMIKAIQILKSVFDTQPNFHRSYMKSDQ